MPTDLALLGGGDSKGNAEISFYPRAFPCLCGHGVPSSQGRWVCLRVLLPKLTAPLFQRTHVSSCIQGSVWCIHHHSCAQRRWQCCPNSLSNSDSHQTPPHTTGPLTLSSNHLFRLPDSILRSVVTQVANNTSVGPSTQRQKNTFQEAQPKHHIPI